MIRSVFWFIAIIIVSAECNIITDEYFDIYRLLELLGIIWNDEYFNINSVNNSFIPSITIYGESHIRDNCVEKKTEMMEQAKKGEFILCLEGLPYSPSWNPYKRHNICSMSYINGIEYSVAHFASLILLKRIELLRKTRNSFHIDASIEHNWPKHILIDIKTKYIETFKKEYIYDGSIVYSIINDVFDAMYAQLSNPNEFAYKSRPFNFLWKNQLTSITKTYSKSSKDNVLKVIDDLKQFIDSQSTDTQKGISFNNLITTHMLYIKIFSELFNIFLMNHHDLKLNNNDVNAWIALIDDPVDRCTGYGDNRDNVPHIARSIITGTTVINITDDVDKKTAEALRGSAYQYGTKRHRELMEDDSYDFGKKGYDENYRNPHGIVVSQECWQSHYNVLHHFLDNFAIQYRDPFMAKYIHECYLKASHYGKNLSIIVGDNHVSHNSKLLYLVEKELTQVQSTNSVKVVRMKEHCPQNTEKQTVKKMKSINNQITTALQSYLELKVNMPLGSQTVMELLEVLSFDKKKE